MVLPVSFVISKGPVPVPTGLTVTSLPYALGARMASAGLASRSGSTGSGLFVVIVTVSVSSAFAVSVTSLRTRGLGSAAWAWSRAFTTESAVISVPSWKSALRSSNVQVVSSACFQDFASAGAAAPLLSSAVSPSATDSLLSTVASLLYGDSACAGGTARATLSLLAAPSSPPVPPSPDTKQPASIGVRASATKRPREVVRMGVLSCGRGGLVP